MCIIRTVSGVLDALERGTKSAAAHKWADYLCEPCRLGGPQRFKIEDKISSGPQVGGSANSAVQSTGSPTD